MQGFQANIFSARGLELTRLGTHTNATGDLTERDWGLTRTRLGTYSNAIGDFLERDWGLTEKASLRCFSSEGSFELKRGLVVFQTRTRTLRRIE